MEGKFRNIPSRKTAYHLNPKHLGGVVDDQLLSGEGHLLELLGVRGRDLCASDTGRRRLEVIKGVFAGECHDLGANAERGEARLDAQHVAGLLDRLDNGLDVEGLDGTEVDDLSLHTVALLQLLSSDERLTDAAGESNDGEILAGALDLGFAELYPC